MKSALAFDNTLATMPVAPSDISILILDDNQFDRKRIRRMFESIGSGFHLSEVESLDALSLNLDSKDFDVVLIDFQLPQGDGLEALAQIQKHERNHSAATVMIAGDDQSKVAVRAMKNGCQDYIPKDALSPQTLHTLVLSAIAAAEARPSELADMKQRLDTLMSLLKHHHVSALQPKISSIIQELRSLRTRVYQPHSPLGHELASIEKRCLGLWASLEEVDAIVLNASKEGGPD